MRAWENDKLQTGYAECPLRNKQQEDRRGAEVTDVVWCFHRAIKAAESSTAGGNCAGTGTCSAEKSADTAALDCLASLRHLSGNHGYHISVPYTQGVTTDPASISSGFTQVLRHLISDHVVRLNGDVFGRKIC